MTHSLTRTKSVLIITLALALAPYLIGLGASTLWDSNEAFYAETPREMVESGDWINPSFNFQPRFNKPPLCYWVVAGSYRALGVSEATERTAIVLGALAMLGAAYGLGRAASSVEAGLLSALTLAASPRFLMFSRRIIIDVYLSAFMALTLLLFVLAELNPKRRRLYLGLMYACVGLGTLTKGPIALVLPALAFLIYLAISRRLRDLRSMMLPAGALIVAAIVLPWYLAVYSHHGWGYIESFLLRDNLSRFAEPIWGPRRGPLFYVPVIIGDLLPWSVFLIPGLWLAISSALRALRKSSNQIVSPEENQSDASSGRQVEAQARVSLLLLIWVVVIVGFFSLSRNKEDLYILPCYPAAAAIVGCLLAFFILNGRIRSTAPAATAAVALALLLVSAGAGLIYLISEAGGVWELAGARSIGWVLSGGGLVTLGLLLTKRNTAAVVASALTLILANWTLASRSIPDFERFKPVRAFCDLIRAEAAPDAMVGYYRFASPSMVFYLRRRIFEYYRPEELAAALSSGSPVYCVMTAADYEEVKESLPAATYVLASRPVFQVKLRLILERAQTPQVVLISNRGSSGTSQ